MTIWVTTANLVSRDMEEQPNENSFWWGGRWCITILTWLTEKALAMVRATIQITGHTWSAWWPFVLRRLHRFVLWNVGRSPITLWPAMRAAPEREIPYLSVPKRFDIPRRGLIGDEFEDLCSIEPVQSEVTTLPRPPHRWRLYEEWSCQQ